MKECKTCGKLKAYTEFNKASTCKDGYRGSCKPCRNPALKEYNSKYREKNKESWNAMRRKYYVKNREKILSDRYRYYHEDGWLKEYQAKVNKHYKRRLKNAIPLWLTDDHRFMIEETYELRDLRTKTTGIPHEVDHIVPIRGKNVSGLHVPWNLQVIPASENRSKGNKH